MSSDRKPRSLARLIVGGLAVWAVACYFVHGPAIAAYIGIQAVTSGVFTWEMRRIEKRAAQQKEAASADQPASRACTEVKAA